MTDHRVTLLFDEGAIRYDLSHVYVRERGTDDAYKVVAGVAHGVDLSDRLYTAGVVVVDGTSYRAWVNEVAVSNNGELVTMVELLTSPLPGDAEVDR